MLNKDLFQKVINNKYIFRIIFNFINQYHKLNYRNSFKWNQLLEQPTFLIKYNYFERVIDFYSIEKNKEDLKLNINNNKAKKDLYNVLIHLITKDRLDHLKYLLEDIIQIATKDLVNLSYPTDLLHYASWYGKFNIVKYLCDDLNGGGIITYNNLNNNDNNGEEFNQWDVFSAVVASTSCGDLDMFKYLIALLVKQRGYEPIPITAFEYFGDNGNLDMFKYLTELYHSKLHLLGNNRFITFIIASGYLDLLKYIKEAFPLNCFRNQKQVLDTALYHNHIEIFHWLIDNNFGNQVIQSINNSVFSAVKSYPLETYAWLHANRTERFTSEAIYYAAKKRDMEAVKWLHNNIDVHECNSSLLDRLAECGYLEIIEWLHLNCSAGCTSKAIDKAAKNGHLHVIKWLHKNRTEGCTSKALDNAIINNQWEVVNWLHENRTEGLSHKVFIHIGTTGNLDSMQWLLQNRQNDVLVHIDSALNKAASYDHLPFMKYLYENKHATLNVYHVLHAFKRGNHELLDWILNTHCIPVQALANEESEFNNYNTSSLTAMSFQIINDYIKNNTNKKN